MRIDNDSPEQGRAVLKSFNKTLSGDKPSRFELIESAAQNCL